MADVDPAGYQMAFARATNSSIVSVAGNLRGHIVEKNEHSEVVELDNGTRRLIVNEPEWFYETLSRPLDDCDDVDRLNLPDVNSYDDYWSDVAQTVKEMQDNGFFVRGTLDGFYAGIWEHCRKADCFLLDLAEGSDFAAALVDAWGTFVCACARKLLECGVDAIWWTDDLGSNTGPLLSPQCYRKYFFPWHQRATALAHDHGAHAMMHSHGNINLLLDHIVETGIDLLDPVGPSDNMNLQQLKQTYGDRLSFSGGISRFIADMSLSDLREHLDEVYRVGSLGGGFLPCEEGGVPRNMPVDHCRAYLEMRTEFSHRYALSRA